MPSIQFAAVELWNLFRNAKDEGSYFVRMCCVVLCCGACVHLRVRANACAIPVCAYDRRRTQTLSVPQNNTTHGTRRCTEIQRTTQRFVHYSHPKPHTHAHTQHTQTHLQIVLQAGALSALSRLCKRLPLISLGLFCPPQVLEEVAGTGTCVCVCVCVCVVCVCVVCVCCVFVCSCVCCMCCVSVCVCVFCACVCGSVSLCLCVFLSSLCVSMSVYL